MRIHVKICHVFAFFALLLILLQVVGPLVNIIFRWKEMLKSEMEDWQSHSTYLNCQPHRMEFRNKQAFNLTLNIYVSKSAAPVTGRTLCRRVNLFDNSCLNFTQLVKKVQQEPIKLQYPNVYAIYPQDVSLNDIVEAVVNGNTIREPPAYNTQLLLLNVSKTICAFEHSGNPHTKYDLIIIVKTATLNFLVRENFREMIYRQLPFLPNFRIGLIFSYGLPFNLKSEHKENLIEPDGQHKKVLSQIYKEIKQFDDIILGDYIDTYLNLSLKTSFNYRFASAFCANATPNFLFMDDDHGVNLKNLQAHLNTYTTPVKRSMFQGKLISKTLAIRNSKVKYFLSINDVPWEVQAPYCSGFTMLVGTDVVRKIAIASAFTKGLQQAEDVFLGLILNKLGISPKELPNLYQHKSSGTGAHNAIISILSDFISIK